MSYGKMLTILKYQKIEIKLGKIEKFQNMVGGI